MKAQEYIINELNCFVEKFQNITFKYKFDKSDSTHIILVEPLIEFEGNNEYLKAESDFVYNFEKTFTNEDILFVSTESLISIDVPDLVFKANQRMFLKDIFNTPKFTFKNTNLERIAGESNYALAA